MASRWPSRARGCAAHDHVLTENLGRAAPLGQHLDGDEAGGAQRRLPLRGRQQWIVAPAPVLESSLGITPSPVTISGFESDSETGSNES